jgi:hypothetical protein
MRNKLAAARVCVEDNRDRPRAEPVPYRAEHLQPGRQLRPRAGAHAGPDRGRGPQPGAITLSNCNGTHCQTVIDATVSLRILACFFRRKRLVGGAGSGNVMRRRSWRQISALGLSARNAEPVGRHATRCPCTAAVRAPGDLPGGAWPTEGPHCHSTGGARPPQVRRLVRLQHELVHGDGAARGTGEWACSWLPRWQRRLLWSRAP